MNKYIKLIILSCLLNFQNQQAFINKDIFVNNKNAILGITAAATIVIATVVINNKIETIKKNQQDFEDRSAETLRDLTSRQTTVERAISNSNTIAQDFHNANKAKQALDNASRHQQQQSKQQRKKNKRRK